MELQELESECEQAVKEIVDAARLKKGSLFVIGCSTSEVQGDRIGTHTNMDVAGALFSGARKVLEPLGIDLAAQCCEHLNRALVVERRVQEQYDLEQVNAIPQPNHAGGAFGTVAYQEFQDPVLVESLNQRADAGLDIGQTLIGMHIHPVVVPVRISRKTIGNAVITCARRRPKYVGGSRAIYDERLL